MTVIDNPKKEPALVSSPTLSSSATSAPVLPISANTPVSTGKKPAIPVPHPTKDGGAFTPSKDKTALMTWFCRIHDLDLELVDKLVSANRPIPDVVRDQQRPHYDLGRHAEILKNDCPASARERASDGAYVTVHDLVISPCGIPAIMEKIGDNQSVSQVRFLVTDGENPRYIVPKTMNFINHETGDAIMGTDAKYVTRRFPLFAPRIDDLGHDDLVRMERFLSTDDYKSAAVAELDQLAGLAPIVDARGFTPVSRMMSPSGSILVASAHSLIQHIDVQHSSMDWKRAGRTVNPDRSVIRSFNCDGDVIDLLSDTQDQHIVGYRYSKKPEK